jgi:hypothetical protein
MSDGTPKAGIRLAVAFFLVTVSLGEIRIIQRWIYGDARENDFVVRSVSEVLRGAPAFPAWQHRFVAPALVAAIDSAIRDRLATIKLIGGTTIVAANLLLFALLRRCGSSLVDACLAVVAFGFLRLLFLYKLEYPWDGINLLLFLLFGYAARTARGLGWMAPFLMVGAFNHESALFIPLWYVLSPLDRSQPVSVRRKEAATAAATLALLVAAILGLRHVFGAGIKTSTDPTSDVATPVIGNPLHVRHNLGQLFAANFRNDRAFISVAVIGAVACFALLAARAKNVRAAAWSLVAIVSIVCFGYVNETRLYVPLVAFWIAYAWQGPRGTRQTSVFEEH